jgi:holo-[acyl-carrier protein] synthase
VTIIGLGTDITEIGRIQEMIDRHGDHFLTRIYTDDEIAYCKAHKSSTERFASRWAAKEAIVKALGTGFIKGISWAEIEIQILKSGKPVVALTGSTQEFATSLGISEIQISMSHSKAYATATAIAVGE